MSRRKDRARTPGLWIATNALPVTGGHPLARAPRRPSASCDAPPRKGARGASGETGLDTIVRDRDVAQQERVREWLRDLPEALACAVAARKRPMNAH